MFYFTKSNKNLGLLNVKCCEFNLFYASNIITIVPGNHARKYEFCITYY